MSSFYQTYDLTKEERLQAELYQKTYPEEMEKQKILDEKKKKNLRRILKQREQFIRREEQKKQLLIEWKRFDSHNLNK